MTISGDTQLPPNYVPYEKIRLCGNVLEGVKFIFRIGPNVPLLVGKGTGKQPLIWLSGQLLGGSWLQLVAANTAVRPVGPKGQRITVIQDATQPLTIVMIGSVIAVDALGLDDRCVDIRNIDFRPIGLNIFGNENQGLRFAGGQFVANTLDNVATAFASNFGPNVPNDGA